MARPSPQLEVIKLSECIGPAFFDIFRRLREQELLVAAHKPVEHQIYELWLKGGRGSLKSSFASLLIANGLRVDSDAHAIVGRRFENELHDSVFAQIKWAFEKLGMYQDWHFTTRPMRARNIRTGQLVLFKGADDPLKLKSLKIPHGYIKYLWMEECDQFRNADDLRSVEQTVFRGKKSRQTLSIYSHNPPKSERAWVNAETRVPMEGRYIHESTYLDAPKDWLGERFIARAEALKMINEPAYNNEYLGIVTGTGTEVFTNIKSVRFDDEEIAAFTNVRQGLDWGYATDPLCALKMSFDPKRMVLRIFAEKVAVGISNRRLDDESDYTWKRTLTYADSSEPKSCDEMRNDYKWNLVNAYKPKGSVPQGIKWLQNLARIEIDPVRCPFTLNEFLTYNYLVLQDQTIQNEYPDKNNHSIDAARYGNQEYIFNLGAQTEVIDAMPQPIRQYWQ